MIRHTNTGRVDETTATPIHSADYPELVTLVTITENGKPCDKYRTDKTAAEYYAYLRKILDFDGYEEFAD